MQSFRTPFPPSPNARWPRRSALALSLVLLSAAAAAQDAAPAPDDIAERLRIVERRLGIAADEGATRTDLAELDRRLRAIELGLDERDRQSALAAGGDREDEKTFFTLHARPVVLLTFPIRESTP